MGTVASYPGSPPPERTQTILSGKGFSFSTQVVYNDDTYQHILTNNQDQSNKIEMPLPFGTELNLEQASIAAKNDVFDKILILLSHGDAEHIELNDGTSGDLALTKEVSLWYQSSYQNINIAFSYVTYLLYSHCNRGLEKPFPRQETLLFSVIKEMPVHLVIFYRNFL